MAKRHYGRILVLLILIIILTIGGLLWFDFLGLIDVKSVFAPVYNLLGLRGRAKTALPAESAFLLDEERLAKQMEALELRSEELDTREAELKKREADLGQKVQELEERQKALDDQEKSFNRKVKEYDNRRVNIDQNAKYLTGMPPEQAVAIIKSMDDQLVIDVFRMVEEQAKKAGEESIVSRWLFLMPADRAAAIQRKMAEKPLSPGQ
jgi:flagellar protein FlbB